DHLDYDLKFGKNHTPICWNHINLDKYYAEWQDAKKQADGLDFCFGVEVGFEDDPEVFEKYQEVFEKFNFDVVINSVHFVNGMDVYFPMAFFFKSKQKMYSDYLDKVLKSLDAPYKYDIVAHLGYVTRNAPYKDKALKYADFPDKFDAILNGVIERGKSLEVNTHHDMNPTKEILERYFALGGRKLSFGSDSHRNELVKDFETVCALLKEIGFENFSVFHRHIEKLIPIE
ncbi:MAG: PHP domain-containing protein, partial [Clostridia bacterium]